MLKREHGWSMIEVLVSLLVLTVGLLGLAGLLMHAQRAEFESFQRRQATIMMQDMVDRISANRNAASCYAFANTTGTAWVGNNASTAVTACTAGTVNQGTRAVSDLADWDNELKGGSEVLPAGGGTTTKVGTALNARGCILNVGTVNDASGNPLYTEYSVTVAWQSLVPLNLPSTAPVCGKGSYDSADQLRRVMTLSVRIPVLG